MSLYRRIVALGVAAGLALGAAPSEVVAPAASSPVPLDEARVLVTEPLAAPAGDWFLTGAARGTPGQLVEVVIGGRRSATLRLDGTWQRFGVTGSSALAGALTMVVETVGSQVGSPILEVTDMSLAASGPTVMRVEPGTRVVTRNGQPWVGRGFNYLSLPIGETGFPASTSTPLDNPVSCQQDARLLAGAGATSLRGWLQDLTMLDEERTRQCLDAFAANGIGFSWIVYGLGENTAHNPDDTSLVEFYWTKIERLIDLYGNHPATEFWMLGNEIDRLGAETARRFYGKEGGQVGLLDELFRRIKQKDPNHLVGSTVAQRLSISYPDTNVPHLDVWGLNVYPQPGLHLVPGSTLLDRVEAWDDRPKLITEIGSDRLRCRRAGDSYLSEELTDLLGAEPPWRVRLCEAGSGDDAAAHQAQANWNAGLWDDLTPLLATPANPQGQFVGAHFFMWSDLWYGSWLAALDPFDTQFTHGVNGWGPFGGMQDGIFNGEFAGTAYAQLRTQTEPRVAAIGLDRLASRWNSAGPTVTGASVSVGPPGPTGCTATISWMTSEPATSELQVATNGETVEGDGLVSDETIYFQRAYDSALRTSHAVTVDLTSSLKGYRLVPRSWSTDGRHGTTTPLTAMCPSL